MSKEDKMIELLEELVRWTKVTSIPHAKKLLEEILQSPEEKTAYQASDEKMSYEEIAKLVNVSSMTISNYGKKWIKNGIARAVPVKGGGQRAVRLFSLEDFGIEIPTITPKPKKSKPVEEQSPSQEKREEQ